MARLEIEIGAINTELKRVLNESKVELSKFSKEINGGKNSLNLLSKASNDTTKALESEAIALAKSKTATQQARQASAELTLANRAAKKDIEVLSGSYQEAQNKLTELGKSIIRAKDGFTSTSPEIQRQIKEYNDLNSKLKEFDSQMGKNFRRVGDYRGEIGSLIPQLGGLENKLGSLGLSLKDLSSQKGLSVLGAELKVLGSSLLAFVGTPVGATVTALGSMFALFQANKQTVLDFNSGMLNVSKTTGLAGSDLSELSKDIIKLSRDLQVVGVKSLTQYATVAGQLGVKGSKNILAFSEALAKLETASDITGEAGGAEIARLLTLTDGGVQNVKQFGDEIVNLGNNFAATEREILANAESIAQNVGIYKIGRQDVLAFGTATKAVGIEAELVGSTFNRTLAVFEKAIRTGNGVQTILKLIGGTQAELSQRFKDDASGVLVDFVGALNRVNNAGGSVNEILEELSINQVRDQRVLQSLATNGYDVLTSALETARNSMGAMNQEFDTASTKLVNQTARIGIAWDNLVLSIEDGTGAIGKSSNLIIGYVADILDAFTDLATTSSFDTAISGFDKITQKLYGFAGAFSASVKIWDKLFENLGLKSKDTAQNIGLMSQASFEAMSGIKQVNFEVKNTPKNVPLFSNQNMSNTLTSVKSIRDEINRLNKLEGSAVVGSDVYNRVQELKAQLKTLTPKKTSVSSDTKLEKQAAIDLNKLAEEQDRLKEKQLDKEKKISDIRFKIAQLTEGDAVDNKLQKDLKALQDMYAEMRKLLGSKLTPEVDLQLKMEESGKRLVLERQNTADQNKEANEALIKANKDAMEQLTGGLKRASNQFVKSMVDGLFDIKNGFEGVFSTLQASFQSVFSNVISNKLTKVFEAGIERMGAKMTMVVAGLGTAGSIISGATNKTSALGQGLGGALSGAAMGASIAGPVGAAVGGLVGLVGGIFGAGKARKEEERILKEQLEVQKRQLEEQRKAALAFSSSIIGQMTNQGVVTGVDRNAFGDIQLTTNVSGQDLQFVLTRYNNGR